jgi:class 3 adenylate cyclase/tetratricopeptide (TPR) repeat protein
MKCPRCQYENRSGAKFCEECATPLARTCSNCDSPLSATAKFCPECAHPVDGATPAGARFASPQSYTPKHLAEKILTSKSALEGERKQVTVLFADLKGSMELMADRDPEEARKILDPVLERMMEAVHRYEGTVNQVMGDGIMALFGAPLAHEDHAVRACYAALRIQKAVTVHSQDIRRTQGLSVQVRVGVNSGEVVVRSIGNDLRMDYTAVGQTTHLAGRMEQMATPGSILITAASFQLAEGFVEVRAVGPVPVRGLVEPIEVYEVIGAGSVRSRLQASATRGLTRFVGRDAELEVLRGALDRALESRSQVVAVVGEAGVGKSRLFHEFIRSPYTQGWLVLESSSVSYGRATPYLPMIDLLRDYFKIDVRDETRTIREKVTAKALSLDPLLQEKVPTLLDLLDALPDDHPFRALDPPQRLQRTLDAIRRLLISESQRQPVLVVFEDLHWSDSATRAILDGLIDALPRARVLLLVNYRPDYTDVWIGKTDHTRLHIDPLPQASAEEMLCALLGSDQSLQPLSGLLIERAEGNPFFLEEMVRMLVETEVLTGERGAFRLTRPLASVVVPGTVQTVLASRIDRLSPENKHLLQTAAVIGKDVPFALLHAIVEMPEEELRGHLGALQAAEFLYETRLFPDLEYTFKHAFTHEVAYATLLQVRRRLTHANILEAIEKLYADRLTEQVEQLAHHALRGEIWDKALLYLRQAGTKAVDRPANREAVALFEQALTVLARLPETGDTIAQAIDFRFDIRNALQPLGDVGRILDYLREAEVLAGRLGDERRLGWVASYLTEHFRMLGNADSAAKEGRRALAIGRRLDDLALQVVTNLPLGLLYHAIGEYRQAMEFLEWNIAHLEGELQRERFGLFGLPAVFSRSFLVWCLAELGEFNEGALVGEESVRIAEAVDQPFSRVYAYLGLGVLHLRKGDFSRAITVLERGVTVGQSTNISVGLAYGMSYLGYALALSGRFAEGLPLLENTVTQGARMKLVARHALRVAYLGEAYLLAGRLADATEAAEQALQLALDHKERGHQAYALRLLGEISARRDEPVLAETHQQSALRLSQDLGMRPLAALCHWSLAALSRRAGNRLTEDQHATAAHALFRQMDMMGWVRWLEAELGEAG